ncbi:MAG: glycosyltransferase [Almyronema sp.]
MKVLMIAPYLGERYGGTSKAIKDLARSLGEQSLQLDLVTTTANERTKLTVPLNKWIEQDTYRIRYFPCWYRHTLIVSFSLLSWLLKNGTQYDLAHTHTIFSPLILGVHFILQTQKIPYITTPHGMLEPWALAYKAWKKKIYYSVFEQKSLQQATAIQALTIAEKQQIQSLGFKTVVKIPNGIYRSQFEQLPPTQIFFDAFPFLKDRSLILFLGRIDPKKGLDLLAKAFAQVVAVDSTAHLVVAGPDSINFLPTVRRYFAQSGCEQQVTFTGMLTGTLKFSALAAAQIYVAPSYSEGFSLSILEGMAAALPCVFTTGCNFPEAAAAEVAYEVDVEANAIAAALITCLQQPQQAIAMGQRAKQFVFENYTWDIIAQQSLEVYRSILHKPGLKTSLAA